MARTTSLSSSVRFTPHASAASVSPRMRARCASSSSCRTCSRTATAETRPGHKQRHQADPFPNQNKSSHCCWGQRNQPAGGSATNLTNAAEKQVDRPLSTFSCLTWVLSPMGFCRECSLLRTERDTNIALDLDAKIRCFTYF